VRAAGSRILIIEDHHDSADMLRFLLQMHGQQVEVARSGEEGLVLAQEFRPDIVLCDLTLEGGISGYEVARRMRADQSLRSVRLIALSGHGSEEDRARTRALGFDLHMVKPIDFGALQRTLGLDPRAGGEALAASSD
jgi:CheY-like chemotaxis protein